MRLDAVVLDIDGLMLDTEPMYKAAGQQAAAELGYELHDVSYLRLVGRNAADCQIELLSQFGQAFPWEAFRLRWSELWRERADTDGISTKAGLGTFLSFLESRALSIAIATSTNRSDADFSLARAGLTGRCGVIVTGDQVQRGKPAPDIYLEVARQLGVEPRHSVALEDSDAGILAANRAGMVPLLIPDVKLPSDQAVASAFVVCRTLVDAQRVIADLLEGESPGAIP